MRPADRAYLLAVRIQPGQVQLFLTRSILAGPAQQDLAVHDLSRGLDDAEDGFHGYALSAAAFADDAEDLAGVHVEAHPVDRLDHAFIHQEIGFQIAYGEEG